MTSNKLPRAVFAVILLFIALAPPGLAVPPRNVILFIGDGMGFEHVRATGMYVNGTAGSLNFEMFPYRGEVTTRCADQAVTDSAAAATAIATGTKVNYTVVSVALPGDGSNLTTMLEASAAQNKMTGLVTTTYMTHATPAAFAAHEPSRYNTSNIAYDYLSQTRPNVLLGGGANGMSVASAQAAGYDVVTDAATLATVNTSTVSMLSGQFGTSHLPYDDDLGALPHLSDMARTALSILDNDPDGFFLMVEGGLIDQAGHENDIEHVVTETQEFVNAVQMAIEWAGTRADTLILVTADHETGGLTQVLNNGKGVLPTVTWTTFDHTAANVPVYAWGVNANLIGGTMDNTDFYRIVFLDQEPVSEPSAIGLLLIGAAGLARRRRRGVRRPSRLATI